MENLRRRTSTFDKCDAAYLQESPSERSAMFSSQPLLSSPQSTHFSSYSLLLAFEWLSFAYSFPQCPSSLDLQLSGQRIPVRSPRESRAFPLNVLSHSTPMHDRLHSTCERTVKELSNFFHSLTKSTPIIVRNANVFRREDLKELETVSKFLTH